MCAEYNEAERLKRQALLSQLFDTKELLHSGKHQGIYVCLLLYVSYLCVYYCMCLLFFLILPNIACRDATKELLHRGMDQGSQILQVRH
jgi:hypothetical protein